MGKKAKAVIIREIGKPVVVEEIDVESPERGEVMVELKACGVCHSDLSATNGTIPFPTPLILGHEGAGIVSEVGEGVTDLAVGDHVVTSFVPSCGRCPHCVTGRAAICDNHAQSYFSLPGGVLRTKDAAGNPVNIFSGCGAMSEYITVARNNIVKIDPDIPLDRAALVGCAVMTGVGAAINTAEVTPGSSAVVFGAGGVGLNVIQGCAIAGANQIIAVDMVDKKLEFAQQFGATHVVNPNNDGDAVAKVRELTGGLGADYGFECIGLGAVVTQTYMSVRKGGTAVVIGVSKLDDMTTIPTALLPMEEKSLKGSWFGSARPSVDFPRLLNLYRSNRLKLDELVTQTYSIDDAPRAFEDLEKGVNARGVITF